MEFAPVCKYGLYTLYCMCLGWVDLVPLPRSDKNIPVEKSGVSQSHEQTTTSVSPPVVFLNARRH